MAFALLSEKASRQLRCRKPDLHFADGNSSFSKHDTTRLGSNGRGAYSTSIQRTKQKSHASRSIQSDCLLSLSGASLAVTRRSDSTMYRSETQVCIGFESKCENLIDLTIKHQRIISRTSVWNRSSCSQDCLCAKFHLNFHPACRVLNSARVGLAARRSSRPSLRSSRTPRQCPPRAPAPLRGARCGRNAERRPPCVGQFSEQLPQYPRASEIVERLVLGARRPWKVDTEFRPPPLAHSARTPLRLPPRPPCAPPLSPCRPPRCPLPPLPRLLWCRRPRSWSAGWRRSFPCGPPCAHRCAHPPAPCRQ